MLADNRAWPDAILELVFGHELAGRTGQNFDDLKGSSTGRHERAKDPEFRLSAAYVRNGSRPAYL
jgi:hypothetical protein